MALMNPVVNINGTSRTELVDQRRKVITAIEETMKALQETSPHGRDYIGKAHQWDLDKVVYRERFALLDKLRNEVLEEALAIQQG